MELITDETQFVWLLKLQITRQRFSPIEHLCRLYLLKECFIIKDKSARVITEKGKNHIDRTLLVPR